MPTQQSNINIGRIQVIEGTPPSLPSECIICRRSDSSLRYVDAGIDIDFYGVVYWCVDCVIEIFNAIGFLTPIQADALETQLGEKERELAGIKNVHRRFLDALVAIGSSTSESIAQLDFSDAIKILQESVKQPGVAEREDGRLPGAENTDSPEHANEQGHPGVLDDADDDFTKFLSDF